ncbi:MerR family transcriptional regulator [Saccharibacillus sp. CPCC 101409]|uniref:helix-turn-helix domain-containing protein n=1 Tax=Saccharibacillus sp. CPCC 101409 TaxID=3058041 RepID=UPI0026726CD1|nr:MerR family transcriptional regulator [Saccharibacillus sp. CPCC 101409]MDO3411107.1 MerR family transcriptional regulator [Saccharibacillus sp. CPCC 101409]
MKISEVAKAAQLPISTIRYYEKMGIIPDDYLRRDRNNYRVYDQEIVRHLDIVKFCLSLGFSVNEVKAMIDGVGCERFEQDRLLRDKITEIEQAQQKLEEAKRHLSSFMQSGVTCDEKFGTPS